MHKTLSRTSGQEPQAPEPVSVPRGPHSLTPAYSQLSDAFLPAHTPSIVKSNPGGTTTGISHEVLHSHVCRNKANMIHHSLHRWSGAQIDSCCFLGLQNSVTVDKWGTETGESGNRKQEKLMEPVIPIIRPYCRTLLQ